MDAVHPPTHKPLFLFRIEVTWRNALIPPRAQPFRATCLAGDGVRPDGGRSGTSVTTVSVLGSTNGRAQPYSSEMNILFISPRHSHLRSALSNPVTPYPIPVQARQKIRWECQHILKRGFGLVAVSGRGAVRSLPEQKELRWVVAQDCAKRRSRHGPSADP